jgi:hypothetical protein
MMQMSNTNNTRFVIRFVTDLNLAFRTPHGIKDRVSPVLPRPGGLNHANPEANDNSPEWSCVACPN